MTMFVSYSHQDFSRVDELRRELDDLSGPVWLDERLTGGQAWWDEILTQIRGCSLFVLAVSRHSLRSEACLAESKYAIGCGRPFLAIRIDDVDVVIAPAAIRQTQLLDYRVRDVECVKNLAKAVLRAPAPGPLPDQLPPEPRVPESYRDRFASLYGETLTMDDQLKAFAVLKYDVDNEVNEDEALQLINELYERRDLSWTLRDEIGTYLAGRAGAGATSNAAPVAAASAPAPTPVPKVAPVAAMPKVAPAAVELPRQGWYVDPSKRFELRYWDGARWTQHVSRHGTQSVDPTP